MKVTPQIWGILFLQICRFQIFHYLQFFYTFSRSKWRREHNKIILKKAFTCLEQNWKNISKSFLIHWNTHFFFTKYVCFSYFKVICLKRTINKQKFKISFRFFFVFMVETKDDETGRYYNNIFRWRFSYKYINSYLSICNLKYLQIYNLHIPLKTKYKK